MPPIVQKLIRSASGESRNSQGVGSLQDILLHFKGASLESQLSIDVDKQCSKAGPSLMVYFYQTLSFSHFYQSSQGHVQRCQQAIETSATEALGLFIWQKTNSTSAQPRQ